MPSRTQTLPRRVSVSMARAPRRESDPKKRVVITGMGVVSVFGNDVGAYYDRLLAGSSGVGLIDRFDASGFSTRFAAQIRGFSCEGHIDDESDRRLDDCQRYALVAARKALASAGLAIGSRAMYKVGRSHATHAVCRPYQSVLTIAAAPADRQGTRRRGRGLRHRRRDGVHGGGRGPHEEGAEGNLPLHDTVRDAQRGVGAGLHRRRDRLPWPQLLHLHGLRHVQPLPPQRRGPDPVGPRGRHGRRRRRGRRRARLPRRFRGSAGAVAAERRPRRGVPAVGQGPRRLRLGRRRRDTGTPARAARATLRVDDEDGWMMLWLSGDGEPRAREAARRPDLRGVPGRLGDL